MATIAEVYCCRMDTGFVVITRYRVDDLEAWMPIATAALAPLVTHPQCLGGEICAAVDEADLVAIVTRWPSVGDYRRAMSSYDVKLHTVPLLSSSIDEPTTYEVLHANGPEGARDLASARALDADTINLGEAAAPSVRARGPQAPTA